MQLNKRSESTGTGSKTLYYGFTEANIVAVNPDYKQICSLYGSEPKEDGKEPSYEGTTKTGNDDYVVVEFWLQSSTPEKQLFRRRIMLTDKEVESKSGKKQYVNQAGQSAYADNEKNLQEFFTKFQEADPTDPEKDWIKKKKINVADKEYRVAIQGEADLYDMLSKWLGRVKLSGKDNDGVYANILVDKKKMFRNIDKWVDSELRGLIGNEEYVTPVVENLTVKTDAEGKHYQNVWKTLPSTIKDGARYSSTISVIRVCAASNSWDKNPTLKKYVAEMTTGDYPCNDAYNLGMLQEWDPNNPSNPISSTNETIRHSEDPATDQSTVNPLEY